MEEKIIPNSLILMNSSENFLDEERGSWNPDSSNPVPGAMNPLAAKPQENMLLIRGVTENANFGLPYSESLRRYH